MRKIILTILFLSFTALIEAQTDKKDPIKDQTASLLVQSGLLQKPDEMMKNWLLARIDEKQIDWEKKYESLKTIEEIQKYQKDRIDYFYKQLGPLWKKTPLNAKITGQLKKNEYRVEKILFESIPGFYVSGTMFLPLESKYKAPYPAVLVLCGHNQNGKAPEWMQMLCVLGAQNGLAMFIIDPIDQGERRQLLKEDGKYQLVSVAAHNVVGGSSILLGRNTATFEVWDMIRALDYLETRKDLVQNGFGAAGISGGGTQTSYIMSLDPRIRVAAPCCYICNLFDDLIRTLGPQDAEQNIFGQIGFGMDHADYCIMRAPKPTLICSATKDFFPIGDTWKSFRFAKRIYGYFGSPEKMDLTEINDQHNYNPELIRSTIRWMLRWLANQDGDLPVSEIAPVLTLDEMRSVPAPGVIRLKNARSTYDLNRDLAKDLSIQRKEIWKSITPEKARDMIRKIAGIRPLADIPKAQTLWNGKKGDLILETEKGIALPVRSNVKAGAKKITLFISDQGRRSEKAEKLFASKDQSVFAVDLRGWGETQSIGRKYFLYDWFGTDGCDYYLAYLLGKSYVGMRTEDLLSVARYLKNTYNAEIDLKAEGYAGTVALHAVIAEPDLFGKITIEEKALPGWNAAVENSPTYIQLTDTIHGVLNYYDISDLISLIKKIKP